MKPKLQFARFDFIQIDNKILKLDILLSGTFLFVQVIALDKIEIGTQLSEL